MMKLNRATIYTPNEVVEDGAIVVSDAGSIVYIGPAEGAPPIDGVCYELQNKMIIPGLIDVHTHGGRGVTFGEGDLGQGLRDYSIWVASTGVTGFLCSIAAPNPERLIEIIRTYVSLLQIGVPGAEALGLHLEGPYLNWEKKGGFNPDWLYIPNEGTAQAFLNAGQGWIRQVTIAPELPGAGEVAELLKQAGVVVALGHSNADFETAILSLNGSFSHVTHTFNAQRGFDHRQPGVLGAILSSEGISAELIADLVHVHPAAMKVLLRCLGTDRIVLVTDGMAGAGLTDGTYNLVGNRVIVCGEQATLADGTIAGSITRLNYCVRNIHRAVGVKLWEAVKMASMNPAKVMGFTSQVGIIASEKDANLAVIDKDANVYLTIVKGKVVYKNL